MQPREAERRAQQLAEHFQDYDDMKFYLKCIYHLTEGKTQYLLESASKAKGGNPRNYFKAAAAKEMKNDFIG